MFTKKDFEVFQDNTLKGRLSLIKEKIDPSFEEIGEKLMEALEDEYQAKFYMKIAKHQRRTTNPPPDTWLAISQDKRGYKKNPHVELGLWPDRYFVTFSLLADAYDRKEYYPKFEAITDRIIKSDLKVSNDHTSPTMFESEKYPDVLKRYMSVKSSDLVIGFDLMSDSEIVKNGNYDQILFDRFMELSELMVEFNQ
ncbi:DUF1054 family protein [Companilactobacillus ginsenosidimutans]|uniref:Uncharacterized protein n=1 Tax=Companilactobacillus ginsenosidimutans TaxID=1007676 RepID=A0A0H4QID5_9LACO|nr:DUF1054 family protein [Companilactobacillus ginsenosidimutans]AKP66393.1 hypothetical protein ABM34_01735 [Companilactobacillus ginsenosidimutans]